MMPWRKQGRSSSVSRRRSRLARLVWLAVRQRVQLRQVGKQAPVAIWRLKSEALLPLFDLQPVSASNWAGVTTSCTDRVRPPAAGCR